MAISQAGLKLNLVLDGMNADTLWQPGQYVDWKTGETLTSAPGPGYEHVTHCSSFAAEAAARLGVSLLGPPPETFLANAQYEWLQNLPSGWESLTGPAHAQRLANLGHFVVITYFNPNEGGSGHIQIVRAHVGRSIDDLETEGPQIIQAGTTNYSSATASLGFSSGYGFDYDPYPWPNNVTYKAHKIPN